jgi:hypothetical protein
MDTSHHRKDTDSYEERAIPSPLQSSETSLAASLSPNGSNEPSRTSCAETTRSGSVSLPRQNALLFDSAFRASFISFFSCRKRLFSALESRGKSEPGPHSTRPGWKTLRRTSAVNIGSASRQYGYASCRRIGFVCDMPWLNSTRRKMMRVWVLVRCGVSWRSMTGLQR